VTKEEYLGKILNDTDLSNNDIGWLAGTLLSESMARKIRASFNPGVQKCPYTFPHTMAWCGRPGCHVE
jgi:hypothetical protein